MRLINHIPAEVCQNLRGVFFDIDDTVTTDGRLEGAAYLAIELGRQQRNTMLQRFDLVVEDFGPLVIFGTFCAL